MIESKFHENKDWNFLCCQAEDQTRSRSRASSTKTRIETGSTLHPHTHLPVIESKFHENKDWNVYFFFGEISSVILIESKFHENKDWNLRSRGLLGPSRPDREQVPRKQGLKHKQVMAISGHLLEDREQVPRKQGLKQWYGYSYSTSISSIESKFHENKDWN